MIHVRNTLLKISAIRGFKDVLPTETCLWQHLETAAVRLLDNFGYREIRVPLLERTELFARSIGTDTDIVEKEMFTFPDRHGELLTLRPEATAGIARAVIEHNLVEGGRPLKLYFIGPMFRYERPQKGRQRQFHQLDVEAFNVASPHLDAEMIILLHHFLLEVGLSEVSISLNSLGCPDCRPAYKSSLKQYFEGKRPDLCPDCRRRLDTNPLRIIDCKVPACQELAKDAPAIIDTLCSACTGHLRQVEEDLTACGLNFELDPRLVRGLDYYNRTIFEVLSGRLGAQNAVAGGGRYDGLIKSLGGPDLPAIGFAVGLERLVMLLTDSEPKKIADSSGPDVYLAALSPEAVRVAFPLIQALRHQGLRVETDYEGSGLKAQMKRADKVGAARVLLLGPAELADGQAILRDMSTKSQTTVPLTDAVSHLSSLRNKE